MMKSFLIAAVLFFTSPVMVFSQDLFLSFDSASNVSSAVGSVGMTGVVTVFSDQPLGFDSLNLDVLSSDTSVLRFTGVTAFNDDFIGGTDSAFNSVNVTTTATGDSGNLFLVNVFANGIDPTESATLNPAFEPGAGSGSGAVRLAELTYDIVGEGVVDLDLSLTSAGQLGGVTLSPSVGAGVTLTAVAVPEPSSAALLVLGALGFGVRRKRARS